MTAITHRLLINYSVFCAFLVTAPAFAQQTVFPDAFAHEPPRVRAALETAYITADAGERLGGPNIAYLEYCEAARMGSAEGHYRAGLVAMGLNQDAANRALFHWRAAEELGHAGASLALAQLVMQLKGQPTDMRVLRDPPDCLVSPPDLIALKALALAPAVAPGLDFEVYARRLPVDRRTVLDIVQKLASKSAVSPAFIMAIAAAESNFNSRALSPKNAMGVMQLIPATAQRFGVRDPYDPHDNIRGGIRYLEWLHARFKGDLKLVAAAYNAGGGAVERHRGVPPYNETQLYVQKVLRFTGHGSSAQK